jgi:hypothetical protein
MRVALSLFLAAMILILQLLRHQLRLKCSSSLAQKQLRMRAIS